MSVRVSSAEAVPFVTAVYVCGCGRTAEQHGLRAGELPAGWVLLPAEGEDDHACPDCAPAADE